MKGDLESPSSKEDRLSYGGFKAGGIAADFSPGLGGRDRMSSATAAAGSKCIPPSFTVQKEPV